MRRLAIAAAVNPPTLTGTRRVWVSSGYTPGVTTPDTHCDGDKPAGVASARALIATTTEPASSVVSSGRRGNLRLVSSWFQSDPSAPCDAGGATVRLYCVEQ